ncbi:MAG: hypothetical protein AB7L09_02895 [Nitrospira sp.]
MRERLHPPQEVTLRKENTVRIALSECIPRRLYEVKARTIGPLAVYAGDGEFVGLQLCMGVICPFAEYHWDKGPPFGTVYGIIDTGVELPTGIGVGLYDGIMDEVTGRMVTYDHEADLWRFVDDGQHAGDARTVVKRNEALFDWLVRQELARRPSGVLPESDRLG